jgi:hypothetical protein
MKRSNIFEVLDTGTGSSEEEPVERKVNNRKKIMCINMINYNKCNYNDKCLYAHNYDEQNVDPIRRDLYNKVISKDWHVDLSTEPTLVKQLQVFTRLCKVSGLLQRYVLWQL